MTKFLFSPIIVAAFLCSTLPAAVPIDVSGVRPGRITVRSSADSVVVSWPDENGKSWTAEFSLDPKKPLITAIAVNGAKVIESARPFYSCSTGKRRGGWDAFFDFPPSHPEGTRSFLGKFGLQSARATSVGNRVEITFDGLDLGIFKGAIRYQFFPGSRLIEQSAVVSTNEPDTAYIYTAGLRATVVADRRVGGNMDSKVTFFDTTGTVRTVASDGPDRRAERVRYRAIAARTGSGSIAVFPAPHQFFFPRDFTTNQGYVWHNTWRGVVSLGIRQLPDDDWIYYPWVNAPPGTRQRLKMYLLVTDGDPRSALDDTLRFTHSDRYPEIPGYQTLSSHWHLAYTVQALEHGLSWAPPFKPVLENLGVHGAMIMDFHGDGHPRDPGRTRLDELDAFYRAARAQSDDGFLILPSEEANIYFGGHWALTFPKPVYWYMGRPDGAPLESTDPKLGTVYHVGGKDDLLALVRKENAFVYQTHPRTKGSTGFPDQTRDEEYFRDPHYFGAGWKALPSDLSSPRLGDRAFKVLDDMNNWGLRKRLIGEVDVFQIDSTHELYSHMNINYVRMPRLPSFDNYGQALDTLRKGDFFVTTGEVLLPESSVLAGSGDTVAVHAAVDHTFPLQMAEVVWGDGSATHRQEFALTETGQFAKDVFDWRVNARGWTWARFAVWDIAGNGAFVNPIWKAGNSVVLLDGYHNNETQDPLHYRWEGTKLGGFSELGRLIQDAGAGIDTLKTEITAAALQHANVFIIADPDNAAEATEPHYIGETEKTALDQWVRNGGRLVLLGNDKGNAEFEHFNRLAAAFGIQFVETTYKDPQGRDHITVPSLSPVLGAGLDAYLVNVAPLRITSQSSETLLADNGTPLAVLVHHGRGLVFALGDPWIYNEYINRANNRKMAENLFRKLLQPR